MHPARPCLLFLLRWRSRSRRRATDAPYAPQPILPGGVVVPLFPAGSPYLKADKVREPEEYNMSQAVPGRISSIVGIHNPSIEVPHGGARHQYRRRGDTGRRAAATTL